MVKSITDNIFGGSDSHSYSNSQNSSAAGFNSLPGDIQGVYRGAINQAQQLSSDPSIYTPLAQTSDESNAFDQIRNGSLNNALQQVSQIQNPFVQSAINDINKNYSGGISANGQAATQAGAFGSTRQSVLDSLTDRQRADSIGNLQGNTFNTALNTALSSGQTDIQNLLGIGGFQRTLDSATKQAPVQGLQTLLQSLGIFSGSSTSQGTSDATSNSSENNGLFSIFKSDRRLKQDIRRVGYTDGGLPIYTYKYIGDDPKIYMGVMAQDVEQVNPDAVVTGDDGFKSVYYSKVE